MSIRLRLILAFAGVFTLGFGALGFGAVRSSADTVERSLSDRIQGTLDAVSRNPQFFIHRAQFRPEELRALADILGFEILVATGDRREVIGSSLSAADADVVAGSLDRSEVRLSTGVHRLSVADVSRRTLCLLTPSAPVEEAKRRARAPILWVVALGLVAAILLGALLAGTVTRPLRLLAERASAASGGRLDVSIPEVGGGEVGGLAAAFREMLAGLSTYRDQLVAKEKMATLGTFSAAVAHELRNPLSAMRMTVQMLRRGCPPEQEADLDLMLSEMTRLDHSVEELLFHAGEPRYEMEDVDLGDLGRRTVTALRPLAEHLGVELDSRGGGPARADPAKIRQAMMNLVLNGLQAAPGGGRVEVIVPGEEGRCGFAVRDNGPGVSAEVRERMFAAFVSGREGGTGLGLAVTESIARAHGGGVTCRREDGCTVFTFRLWEED